TVRRLAPNVRKLRVHCAALRVSSGRVCMFRAARTLSTSSSGARRLATWVSWFTIAGGLLAPTCANAPSPSQTRSDSTASAAPAIPPAVPAPAAGANRQKTPNYALHLQGGLFAPIDVNATSPTIGLRIARNVGGHLQAGLLTAWT